MTNKLDYPATGRNREALLEVLRGVLPQRGTLLEISAGSGQHAAFLAPQFPDIDWHPTDFDAGVLKSIDAWAADSGAANLRPAKRLDVTAWPWPLQAADVVLNVNMIHIAPWACTLALMQGAGNVLPAGGHLIMYGPYLIDGVHTAPSNRRFDDSLRARDPSWGVRDLTEVALVADGEGLELVRRVPMPANNFTVIYKRRQRGEKGA
jgi:hypothetical protein